MNLKTTLSKKSLLIVCSSVLLVVVVGITLALLQSRSQTAHNNFTSKAVNIGVIENNGTTNLENKDNIVRFEKIKKGTPITKKVQVKNIDSKDYPTTDTLIRVRLVPCLRYDDNSKYAGQLVPTDIIKNVSYDINTTNWKSVQESGETYYYYLNPLAPNELTEPLFTKVTYNADVPANTYFELQVLADGINANQALDDTFPWGYNVLNSK